MMEKISEFEMADYLDAPKKQQIYLDTIAEEGTNEEFLKALETVAKAQGMTKTAKKANISRDGLYKALSPNGNPTFETMRNILKAIGFTISVKPIN